LRKTRVFCGKQVVMGLRIPVTRGIQVSAMYIRDWNVRESRQYYFGDTVVQSHVVKKEHWTMHWSKNMKN